MNYQALSSFVYCEVDQLRSGDKQSEHGKVIFPFAVLGRSNCKPDVTDPSAFGELKTSTQSDLHPILSPLLQRLSCTSGVLTNRPTTAFVDSKYRSWLKDHLVRYASKAPSLSPLPPSEPKRNDADAVTEYQK